MYSNNTLLALHTSPNSMKCACVGGVCERISDNRIEISTKEKARQGQKDLDKMHD
jgi:hypothetical protein